MEMTANFGAVCRPGGPFSAVRCPSPLWYRWCVTKVRHIALIIADSLRASCGYVDDATSNKTTGAFHKIRIESHLTAACLPNILEPNQTPPSESKVTAPATFFGQLSDPLAMSRGTLEP